MAESLKWADGGVVLAQSEVKWADGELWPYNYVAEEPPASATIPVFMNTYRQMRS